MTILLELDSYPFILQGFPRGRKAEKDLHALFDQMAVVGRRAVERGDLHVVVALGDEDFNAAERKTIATCMADAPPADAACVIGAVAVIESTMARGVVTALKWLTPRALPIIAAATPDEAIDLAEDCLRAKGILPPAAIREGVRIRARQIHAEMRRAKAAES
jgi:hypothetical protein